MFKGTKKPVKSKRGLKLSVKKLVEELSRVDRIPISTRSFTPRFAGKYSYNTAKRFWRKGSFTSSSSAGALTLGVAGSPTGQHGLIVGLDVLSGWPVIHDPFTAYLDRSLNTFTSTNVAIIGDIGEGKSSLIKTFEVIRALLLGYRVIVVDKKLQANDDGVKEGEYNAISRLLGIEPIKFRTDMTGSCLNLLDPKISSHGGETVGQQLLLESVAAQALGRDISAFEATALRCARQSAISECITQNRHATIHDVIKHLLSPSEEEMLVDGIHSVRELFEWGREVGFGLSRLVETDLKGIVDKPTSPEIKLNAALTIFDISAINDDSLALPVLMNLISTWLRSLLMEEGKAIPTIFVIEEGWHIVSGSFAQVVKKNTKISRGIGLSNVVAIHHLSDLPENSAARSVIKEAQTVFVYKQANTDEAEACVKLLGWDKDAIGLLQNLPQGTCLMQIGKNPPVIVKHIRSRFEKELSDTDSAIESSARTILHNYPDLLTVNEN